MATNNRNIYVNRCNEFSSAVLNTHLSPFINEYMDYRKERLHTGEFLKCAWMSKSEKHRKESRARF